MAALLEVRELTKHFGDVKAVNGISFAIEAGTCFGLLGPNGAGKTTTIEMVEGITTPTSGEIFFRGKPRADDFAHNAGIQFQSTALMDYLTVSDVLNLFRTFYKKTTPLAELIERCDIGDFLNREASKLSGGQRQRLLLALALINDPDILFLDEPTTGLDPQSRRKFWSLINTIKTEGKTVLLTTHYMDEAESLCDTLVIVDHGKIVAEGTPQALLHEHFQYQRISLDAVLDQILPSDLTGSVYRVNGQLHIETPSVETTIKELINAGVPLNSLSVHDHTLEDLFIKITGHALRS